MSTAPASRPELLARHVGEYQAQADMWMRDHALGKEHDRFAELLNRGLVVYREIQEREGSWAARIESGEVEFRIEDARATRELYSVWLDSCKVLLASLAQLEAEGFQVAGAAEFRAAALHARGALAVPLERLAATLNESAESESLPTTADVLNGLRRKVASRGPGGA